MKKLCLIYDTAPRYREAVYTTIDHTYDCDWYIGTVQNNIKEMDFSLLKNVYRYNIFGNYNKLYWQTGIIKLLFDKQYDTYLIGLETRALSKWFFFFISAFFFRKKKIFVWTHGWYGKETALQATIKRWIYNKVTGTFLYGDYARQKMINQGIDSNKLFVIHNSLHYDQQKALREKIKVTDLYLSHFKNNYPVLVFIGRLTKVKRLDMIISAVYKLRKQQEFYNIVFIGDGVEKDNLIIQAENLNISEQIWFYGACFDETRNAELIVNADLCVSPGNVGLTAMHSLVFGCPVITHNCFEWQMPEFEAIKEGVTGDFFERNNVDSLAQSISKWFNINSKRREEVRKACYDEIDTKWNPYFQIDLIKSVIK